MALEIVYIHIWYAYASTHPKLLFGVLGRGLFLALLLHRGHGLLIALHSHFVLLQELFLLMLHHLCVLLQICLQWHQ